MFERRNLSEEMFVPPKREADQAMHESSAALSRAALISRKSVHWIKISFIAIFCIGSGTALYFLNTKPGEQYVPQPKATAAVPSTPLPDLVAGDVIITGIQSGSSIESQHIGNVQNRSTVSASAFQTIFEVDFDSSVFSDPDKAYFAEEFSGLAPNEIVTLRAPIFVPALPIGTHAMRLCVDVFGQIAESNEDNNCGPGLRFTIP